MRALEVDDRVGAARACALAMLVLIVVAEAAASLTWILANKLMPQLAMSAALCAALIAWTWQAAVMPRRNASISLVLLLLLAGGCLGMAMLFHDLSFDGQQYHQQGALALAGGWNPYRGGAYIGPYEQWINGYAKGVWTWAALFPALNLSVELGKSINLALAATGGLCTFDLLRNRLRLNRWRSWIVSTTAMACPVVATQWTTFTNDGIVGSLMLIFVTCAVALARADGQRTHWELAMLALVLCLLPLVKGSGAVYAALAWGLLALGLAWFANRRQAWRWAVCGGGALAVGILLLGFNPYVTNLLRHGHSLYPLAGAGKVDIITPNAPTGILEHGRLAKLLGSVFSRSHSEFDPVYPSTVESALRMKLPGAVYADEIIAFTTKTDVRIGGFGPLFGLEFLLGSAAFVVALRTRHPRTKLCAALFVPVALLMMSLAFPEPWWARYVPQLWLVPLGFAVALWILDPLRPAALWLAWCVVWVAAVDALVVAGSFVAGSALRELDHRAQLQSLREIGERIGPVIVEFGQTPSLAHRLSMRGVRWQAATDQACTSGWQPIEFTGARVCLTDPGRTLYVKESPSVSALKRALGRD